MESWSVDDSQGEAQDIVVESVCPELLAVIFARKSEPEVVLQVDTVDEVDQTLQKMGLASPFGSSQHDCLSQGVGCWSNTTFEDLNISF